MITRKKHNKEGKAAFFSKESFNEHLEIVLDVEAIFIVDLTWLRNIIPIPTKVIEIRTMFLKLYKFIITIATIGDNAIDIIIERE
ncbi:protein of unknown function [Clostridium beijerinckii]|nr:protein of unknown function [Clostridium beijerinckii]